jgi:L-threonylcarbamoyladenylate synthase
MADLAHQFLAALHAGRACLHPTDTLPGLTFDPTSAAGRAAVVAIKGRDEGKPFLGLAASLAQARRMFAPLPGDWAAHLATLWPGPLSVVWTASPEAPRSLVAADGTLGLRVPLLPVDSAWFMSVLERSSVPLPTTSVNKSGQPPARGYAEASSLLLDAPGAFVPMWRAAGHVQSLPSTVIRLYDDGSFSVLREGAMAVDRLSSWARRVG